MRGCNRIAKIVFDDPVIYAESDVDYTFYIRDAQGNVMSTYTLNTIDDVAYLFAAEQPIYGSSRLGMRKSGIKMIGAPMQTNKAERNS